MGGNTDIGSLFMSGSNSGTHPTIVAIPLYIRKNLSKYPSIYELLSSSNSFPKTDSKLRKNLEIQPNVTDANTSLKKLVNDNTKQNDFTTTQRLRTQTQKSTKYNIKEEQQKAVRYRDQHKYETQTDHLKDSADYSSPQKTQWSSHLNNNPNRYSQTNERTYSRPLQRYPIEERSKQSLPEIESVLNTFSTNKFNDLQNNDQKGEDSSDYGSVDAIKPNSEITNQYNSQSYSPFTSSEGKVDLRNRETDRSTYSSPQTSSYGSENSEDSPNIRYSDSDYRIDNYSNKNDNKYENQDNNEYENSNKNNEFQYRSPAIHIRSYDRSIQPKQYIAPMNTYISRPNSGLRQTYGQTYENSFVTSKPLTSSSIGPISSSDDDSSQSSNNYNNNYQSMSSLNGYNSQTNPSNNGADPQINGYAVNPTVYNSETQTVSPNNNYYKTESKSQFTSISNPNYSSDYSTPEDIDCFDENSNDYQSTHSSQSNKSPNIRSEIDTKSNDGDSYETEDLDPSKLDLKIVHLPVSLLRRLIGNGEIGLPSYQ